MTAQQLKTIFDQAPVREFENGPKLRGFFQKEIVAAGISKSFCKRLVSTGVLKMGQVQLRSGTQNFYTFNELK